MTATTGRRSPHPVEHPPSRGLRWATSWPLLFAVVLGVYQLNVVDLTGNDPALAPFTAVSIVSDGDLGLDEFPAEALVGRPLVITGTGDPGVEPGHVFDDAAALARARRAAGPGAAVRDYFPVVGALLAVPGVVLTDAVSWAAGTPGARELLLDGRFTPVHVASAALVVALAVLVARALALEVLGGSLRRRRLLATAAAAVLAFGTTAWSVAGRALWQHGPALLAAMTALWMVVRLDPWRPGQPERPAGADRRDALVLGAAAAVAVLARPTTLALALGLAAWLAVRRRAQLLPAAAGAGGVALSAAVLLAALGSPVPPPYYAAGRLGWHDAFVEALAANWFSPSRGLLWATPVVLLAVPGAARLWKDPARRPLVAALVAAVLLTWVSVSAFPQWWAGHTFGPRFLTEALAPLFLLALPTVDAWVPGGPVTLHPPGRARAALAVVVVLSAWSVGVHALGSLSRQTACWNTTPVDVDEDPGRVWSVTDSQVGRSLGTFLDGDLRRAVLGPC